MLEIIHRSIHFVKNFKAFSFNKVSQLTRKKKLYANKSIITL